MTDGAAVAVVGCGYWGIKHLRVLGQVPGVSRVVAIDSSAVRREAIARALSNVEVHSSLDAIDQVDAVVLATPPHSHAGLGASILSAGKHLLVEKPMTTRVEDSLHLIELSNKSGLTLMVGHTFQYNAAVWRLREAVESGEIGRVRYIDTARLNLGLYQSDVNVAWDLAPHDISIVTYLMRGLPTSVDIWAARHAHKHLEDVAYLRMQYADEGVMVNSHVSWLDPCKVRRVTVVGDEKMVVYNDMSDQERIRVYDKGVAVVPDNPVTSLAAEQNPPMSYRLGGMYAPYVDFQEPLLVQDSEFVAAFQEGRSPHSDGWVGLGVVAVLEAADLALERGRSVDLAEVLPAGLRAPASLASVGDGV